MKSVEYKPQLYELSGGSLVEVYQPFGNEHYFAIVALQGRYPETGKVAHNIHRTEHIQLLEGNVKLTINNLHQILQPGLNRLPVVEDNNEYFLEGNADLVVFVEDQEGAETIIIPHMVNQSQL